ncbi:hypothetical protein Bca4012_030088 [Brassica carinata]
MGVVDWSTASQVSLKDLRSGWRRWLAPKTGAEQLVKKARTMTTESSMKDAFSLYADYLNNFKEKRESGEAKS